MIHLICPNPALDRTLLVHKVEKNIPIRPFENRDLPGGKSFNVAYALQSMGYQDFVIHTLLGGPIGKYIEKLNTERENRLSITKSPQNTRTCSIYVETDTNDVFLFYEKGLEASQELIAEYVHSIESQLNAGDIVVFSGSLMKGMPHNFMSHFIQNYPEVKVIVDTSGPSLIDVYQSHPYFIKINNEEFKELYPELHENDMNDVVRVLKEKVKHEKMIVTMGAKGSVAKINGEVYTVTSPKIQALNPIASGDFYLGVLIKGLTNQEDPAVFLKEAAAFSTANCLNFYPEVEKNVYQDLLSKVTITKVSGD